MKKYEAVFILDIRKVDDDGEGFSKEFAALVEKLGGKLDSAVPMGRRQFTYDVKKRKGGFYWDFMFQMEEDKVGEIKNKFRLDERVLRNLVLIDDRPEVVKNTKLAE